MDHIQNDLSTIRAILFDADGVLQRPCETWRADLTNIIDRQRDGEAFIAELFEAERPCLAGKAEFGEELAVILERWGATKTVEEVLSVWTNIEVDLAVMETVGSVRKLGISCCLASNQQSHRARYMSKVLGYCNAFDKEFYSCNIGHAKPDHAYFEHIVGVMKLAPEHILFFDDLELNVAAARHVGIKGVHFQPNAGSRALMRLLVEFGVKL